MTTNKPGNASALSPLGDAVLDSILNLSDADLAAEMRESGLDPSAEAEAAKSAIMNGIKASRKAELISARSEMGRFSQKIPLMRTPGEMAKARSLFDRMKSGDGDLANKMMMAARKGEGLSERDLEGIAEDLADLQKLGKESD